MKPDADIRVVGQRVGALLACVKVLQVLWGLALVLLCVGFLGLCKLIVVIYRQPSCVVRDRGALCLLLLVCILGGSGSRNWSQFLSLLSFSMLLIEGGPGNSLVAKYQRSSTCTM